jgi:UDP-glucose 4-epimerase
MTLKDSRAIVTGGAGFIGSHLVEKLYELGLNIVIIDNLLTGKVSNINHLLKDKKVKLIKADIRNLESIKKSFKDVEYVFHLASQVRVDKSIQDPVLTNDININGTLNILKASLKTNVERFIFASSAAVYGDVGKGLIDENAPKNPITPYGASKLAAESYCKVFHKMYGLKVTLLRYFNVYGPRQKFGVVANFVKRVSKGLPPIIYGDGMQTRDFVHVYDAIEATLLASKSTKAIGEAFNIASGKATSINELAKKVVSIFGKINLKPVYKKAKFRDIRHCCGNILKAKDLLEYKPKISLETGLLLLKSVKERKL